MTVEAEITVADQTALLRFFKRYRRIETSAGARLLTWGLYLFMLAIAAMVLQGFWTFVSAVLSVPAERFLPLLSEQYALVINGLLLLPFFVLYLARGLGLMRVKLGINVEGRNFQPHHYEITDHGIQIRSRSGDGGGSPCCSAVRTADNGLCCAYSIAHSNYCGAAEGDGI